MGDLMIDIQYARFIGARMAYQQIASSSPEKLSIPTVFLGGAFQSIHNVQNYAKHSAEYADTVMVDMLGFGDSDLLHSSYSMELVADSVEHLIRGLGYKRINLAGTSYGAVVSYIIAGKYPELVNRLVIGGFMDNFDPDTQKIWEQAIWFAQNNRREEFAHHMSRLLLNKDKKSEIRLQDFISSMMVKKLLAATNHELNKFIYSIERLINNEKVFPSPPCPTLMMTGVMDSFTTPEHHRKLHEAAPDSTLALIDGADHMFHLEQFETTSQLMKTHMMGQDIATIAGHTLSNPSLVVIPRVA